MSDKFKLFKLYWHTLKYVRISQLFYRIYYKFHRVQLLDKRETIENKNKFIWEGPNYAQPSLLKEGLADFLNEVHSINGVGIWNDESKSKLWLYNLHYLDDLCSKGSQGRIEFHREYIYRWIDENPPAVGNGWEPYPTSLRLVNLVKWSGKHQIFDDKIYQSIYQQSYILLQQVEYHILANHLFANAKALIFAGAYLGQNNGQVYLEKGIKILKKQVKEQFLNDGAHFELSPMYHSILLWDILDLIALAKVSNVDCLQKELSQWMKTAAKSCHWLRKLCHPDGQIAFFNDATIGIAPEPQEIFEFAASLGIKHEFLENASLEIMTESGFTRMVLGFENHILLINHANIGPAYQPGHAHADTLSFELSLFGQRVLVNSGISKYGISKDRDKQRSTIAHNTLCIDNKNSSEVWNGFRVAKRANVINFLSNHSEQRTSVSADHDGYKRIQKEYIHHRKFNYEKNELTITDELRCTPKHPTCVMYHLHPGLSIREIDNEGVQLVLFDLKKISLRVVDGLLSIEKFQYHPGFGLNIESHALRIQMVSNRVELKVKWMDC